MEFNYLLFGLGAIVVIVVVAEVLVTTLVPHTPAHVSERVRGWVWRFFHWASRKDGTKTLLNYAGMVTIFAWLVGWIFLFWLGNTLLFLSDTSSLLNSTTNAPVSAVEKIYFTGYLLSTAGLGDVVPNGTFWKLYTSIISFSGFVIISLSITYFIPILSAETTKRVISLHIHSLGTSPEEILCRGWNGKDFNGFATHFNELAVKIMELSKNHVAYPVLHNFHSHDYRESIYLNITSLDEALTILLLYVPDDVKPHKFDLLTLRHAISDFLNTLRSSFISQSEKEPPSTDLKKIRECGIPIKQGTPAEVKNESLILRRKLLLGMMENDGWRWEDLRHKNTYTYNDIDIA